MLVFGQDIECCLSPPGAASDKVKALEKAGAIVTDSPAKIGSELLKVCDNNCCVTHVLNMITGDEGGWTGIGVIFLECLWGSTVCIFVT
jgi:hypothetical protein